MRNFNICLDRLQSIYIFKCPCYILNVLKKSYGPSSTSFVKGNYPKIHSSIVVFCLLEETHKQKRLFILKYRTVEGTVVREKNYKHFDF